MKAWNGEIEPDDYCKGCKGAQACILKSYIAIYSQNRTDEDRKKYLDITLNHCPDKK